MKDSRDIIKRKPKFVYIIVDAIAMVMVLLLSNISVFFDAHVSTILISATFVYVMINVTISIFVMAFFGIYKVVRNHFYMVDIIKLVLITLCSQVICYSLSFCVPNDILVKPFWYVWLLSAISLCFMLILTHCFHDIVQIIKITLHPKASIRTAIIGAGQVAKALCDDTYYSSNNKNEIVVLVDDDYRKINGLFMNHPVEGPIANIANIVDKYGIETVIIAISDLTQRRLSEILMFLRDCNVRVKRAPLLSEMDGPYDSRVMNINLDELLCRKPIMLDNSEIQPMLYQKTVLVTGAGGSIGSELVRQIFNVHPKTLILFDIYENGTYNIQMELVQKMRNEHITDIDLITLIGSTYNEQRMEQIISKYLPDYIYHAAAYKHVPLMEDSPQEAIRTNVFGTYNVAKLADKYGVKKMVLVSTDKAVRPTNVMGATKRFAEEIIQYFSSVSKNTQYAAVRFGNVLGSNGSVVPLFKKQIESGGPITITDKNIIRYFMTIPEAVSLILQCSLYATGGEIFILDMGEPVKILTLAEMLIRQAGYRPYEDIKIVETGLRPGEKLYEELLVDKNKHQKTANERIYIEEKRPIVDLNKILHDVEVVFEYNDISKVKEKLSSIVDEYKCKKV